MSAGVRRGCRRSSSSSSLTGVHVPAGLRAGSGACRFLLARVRDEIVGEVAGGGPPVEGAVASATVPFLLLLPLLGLRSGGPLPSRPSPLV